MSKGTKFQQYNPNKLYDIILLLAGENTKDYPRSKEVLRIYGQKKVGSVFVTGGYGGFATKPLGMTDGEQSMKYLIDNSVADKSIFFDFRSKETLGNFCFPTANPITVNPGLNDLESILLITEKGHMRRALECASKVIPKEKLDYHAAPGPYRPDLVTKAYHAAMMHALRYLHEPDAHITYNFLLTEHPFYKEGWYDKSLFQRKFELGKSCLNWFAR